MPGPQSGGEFTFQTEVTYPAILISFLLSVVLIIITRILSLAGGMSPRKIYL